MPEQTPKILKLLCVVLAAVVLYQLAHIIPRVNILGHVVIPELPTLTADKTNAPATNLTKLAADGTNKPNGIAGTNALSAKSTNGAGTNLLPVAVSPKAGTNSAASEKNAANATNLIAISAAASTNSAVETNTTNVVVSRSMNAPTNLVAGTNLMSAPMIAGTNGSISNLNAGTNMLAGAKAKSKRPNPGGPPGMMMAGMGFNPRGAALPELPPEIKARVDRVFESEILAQAMRPLPMGLIGIAGDTAFLRSASGQTGLVKEGDTLADLKLLRIGINRVLVEQAGQQKELMIFDGYGGTSLLPEKGKNPE